MSAHKSIDKICAVIVAFTLVISVVFCFGKSLGIGTNARAIGYEDRIFDHSKVHTIDIVMNDWDGFITTCENEEYTACNLVIDGEAVRNVGIRAKGNTSLSSVKNMDSSRYSFKIEFDQYENGKSYHGLDKLCLNNIIQDNTYMKDYLAYTLMYDFGVDTPLCSYAYITVNGEDWGLYLAVEAIEDSFLERNYGSNYGELYKPDAMSFGAGRGNGKDFSMTDFVNENSDDSEDEEDTEKTKKSSRSSKKDKSEKTDTTEKSSDKTETSESSENGGFSFGGGFGGEMPSDFDPSNFDPSQMFGEGGMPDFGGEMPSFGDGEMPSFEGGEMPDMSGKGGFGGGFGMGSDDVKLKYTDDDIDSYSNIFNNAKTVVNKADKKRLISSLKALSEQTDLENTLDVEEVIRYFVVHDFLVNGDSYTGQMIHNYYLYEEDGQLSMIPWDYNLAYGSFMGGNASSSVNSPIDTPVSNGMSDRPMVSWIFDNETYTEQYHELFSEFLESVDFESLISETAALIDKYVEKDPTKFCTYEEFKTGVEAITQFCTLRAESVSGQLDGSIPSTSDGQKEDSSALIDTGDLNTSDMGSMGGGAGGGFGGFGGGKGDNSGFGGGFDKSGNKKSAKPDTNAPDEEPTSESSLSSEKQPFGSSSAEVKVMSNLQFVKNDDKTESDSGRPQRGNGGMPDFGGQPPQGFGGDMPEGFDPSNMPEGFTPGDMPEDFDPSNMPDGFDPSSMPKDIAPESQTETENSEDTSVPAETSSQDEKTTDTTVFAAPEDGSAGSEPSSQPEFSRDSRPQMGDFSPMDAAQQSDNTAGYILIGVSALILLIGLGIAFKFKR